MPNIQIINYVRNCLHRNVALTISMRLSHYRRNFLHRRVMLNYINSHYVRNCLHRNVGFNTFNETEQLRTEFPASSRSANLFIYYLTTMFITKINQLHEIGKDLKWRTTYLYPRHSPSSVSTRLVDVASVPTGGRRSRALSRKQQLH